MKNLNDFYKDKTVTITGASGYIAGALINKLKETSCKILCVSRQDLEESPGLKSFRADIRSKECWENIVSQSDIVFHLAGNTSVYAAAKDPADSLNSTVLPIAQLIAASQLSKKRIRVIYASTVTVYGLTEAFPVKEEGPVNPITIYDLHKNFAEEQLKFASQKGILEGISLRLANVYGPSSGNAGSDDRGILNKITKMALKGKDIQLYGGGGYLRDYVYIDDVVKAFLLAGETQNISNGIFHVASGESVTVRAAFGMVAEQVSNITGKNVNIYNTPLPEDIDLIEVRNFIADPSAIYKALHWKSETNLKEGINSMISSFKENLQ